MRHIILAHPMDPRAPRLGGANRYVLNILKCLENKSMRNNLIFLGVELLGKDERSLKYKFIPVLRGSDNAWLYIFKLMILMPLLKLPDKAIVHVQRTYFIIPFLLWKPRYIKIVTMHTLPLEYVRINYPIFYKLLYRLYLFFEKYIVRRLDLLIAVNEQIANFVKENYNFDKVLMLSGAIVDTQLFRPADRNDKIITRKKIGVGTKDKVIIYVGRLEKIKRVDLLLRAFKHLKDEWHRPNLKLLIVGDGSQREYLINLAKKLKIEEYVIFKGMVSPEEVAEFYKASDLFVLTSISEASPNTVREALACGIKVISTNVGDVAELRGLPCVTIVPLNIDESKLGELIYRILIKQNNDEKYKECIRYVTIKNSLRYFCKIIRFIYKKL